jgi:hypothetical protein
MATREEQVPAIYGLMLEDLVLHSGAAANVFDLDLERDSAVKDSPDPTQLEGAASKIKRADLAEILRERARSLRAKNAVAVVGRPSVYAK